MNAIALKLAMNVPPLRKLGQHRNDLLAENAELRRQQSLPPAARVVHSKSNVGSLCSVVNPAHWLDAEWLQMHHDLSRYSIDKHCFQNCSGEVCRKGWE